MPLLATSAGQLPDTLVHFFAILGFFGFTCSALLLLLAATAVLRDVVTARREADARRERLRDDAWAREMQARMERV